MAYEIVSTSSPSNLEGKTGFGTVIKTQRLPIAIDIAVSGLNGYTHLFGAGDPKNPICWSYLQIRADSKTYYVLSRIADCGADHTLRSNRLASHLILQARELTSCNAGPVAIMQGGEIISSYNGSAREVPERVLKPYSAQPSKVCQRWKQLTGDAGWAGLLAESVMSNKPAYVIYNPGTDILPLFAEAINLIPASFRWKATFSTYYSSQVERYNCLWRGIVMGSPSANAIPQGDYVVIDLTKPLPALNKTSNLITLARKGASVNPTTQPSPTSMDSVVNKGASASGTISTSSLPSVESTFPDPMTNTPMSKQPAQPVYIKQKASLKGVWITMFLLFLIIGATGGGLYYTIDAINKSLATNHQNLSAELNSVQDAFNSFQKDYSTWKMQTDSWKNQTDSKSEETSGNQKASLDELRKEVNKLSNNLKQQEREINKRIDDKFDPLKISIDNAENKVESLQGSLKESRSNEVKCSITEDFDFQKESYFIKTGSRESKKFPIEWNPEKPQGDVSIDNHHIHIEYNKQDKSFTFTFPDNGIMQQYTFVYNGNKELELSKIDLPSHSDNNANNDNILEKLNKLEGRIKKLEEQMEKSKLTAVIRIEKTIDIQSVTCAFCESSNPKNFVQKITGKLWQAKEVGIYKTSVNINNSKIDITYIKAEKKFIATTDNINASETLKRYPFSVASSDPVYFISVDELGF